MMKKTLCHKNEKGACPLIAITMGDPAGVGPEIIAGAWKLGSKGPSRLSQMLAHKTAAASLPVAGSAAPAGGRGPHPPPAPHGGVRVVRSL